MTNGNGWSKYERDVMNRLNELRDGQQTLTEAVTDHVQHCEHKFEEHAVKIERSRWFGVLSSGGIVGVFLLALLIMQVLK